MSVSRGGGWTTCVGGVHKGERNTWKWREGDDENERESGYGLSRWVSRDGFGTESALY